MDDLPNSGEIRVESAPAIDGLRFRHFMGDVDYASMWNVYNHSNLAYGLDELIMPYEKFRHVNAESPNHDPEKDLIIAEVEGRMIAYMKTVSRREIDGTYVNFYSVQIVPEWRGKGVDRALLRWIEERVSDIHASREAGSAGITSIDAHNIKKDLIALLESEGYLAVRYWFEMETDDLDHIPEAPLPPGLEIRPALPGDYLQILKASVDAFRDEWGAVEMSDADIERWLHNPEHQPEMWVVAWDGDQVAGSILNYIDHERNERTQRAIGYTEMISVGRPWRKRGLARAMLARSMQVHKDAGMTQTELGVDADNLSGALRLYESMGYKVVSGGTTYRKTL